MGPGNGPEYIYRRKIQIQITERQVITCLSYFYFMDTENLRSFCLSLPATQEAIKFEDHLSFTVAEKIFCITGFGDNDPVSLKVSPEDFDVLTERDGIKQAAYFAKKQWVSVQNRSVLRKKEWEEYLRKSYDLVKSKLPKKVQKEIDEQQ